MLTQTHRDDRVPATADAAAPRRFSISSTAGVRLVGDERGHRSDESVLLLHATGRSREMWSSLASELAFEGLHVLTIDLHGHGDSDWSADGDYSIDSFVTDVHAVCQQRGPFSAVLGASLGAVAAVLAAARASASATAGLVLVDVEPTIESPDMHRIRAAVSRTAHPWKCDPRALDICQRPLGRARNELIARALAAVTAPVLVVRGALPRPASVAGARRLASLSSNAEAIDLSSRRRSRGEPATALSSLVAGFVQRTAGAA